VVKIFLEAVVTSAGTEISIISCALCDAIVPANKDFSQEEGMRLIASKLIHNMHKYRPDLLPTLFPVFAMMCGDRGDDDLVVADINWSLM